MSDTMSTVALTVLCVSGLASWIALAVAAARGDRSGRWIVTGAAFRVLLAVIVLALLRAVIPTWPAIAIGVAVTVLVLSAEVPGWLRAANPRPADLSSGDEDGSTAPNDVNGSAKTRLDDVQSRFLSGLVSLKSKTVAQAMVPRDRMVTVNQDWSVSRAVKAIQPTEYARIPVVGRDPREVVGVVHRKDLLLLVHTHQEGTFVKNISRDVEFVPASQRLDRLLVKFQKERLHLAVVPDEYGRAAGLITMDDILTEAFAPRETQEHAS
jgi:CBS domain containing-hemolysin-like protein